MNGFISINQQQGCSGHKNDVLYRLHRINRHVYTLGVPGKYWQELYTNRQQAPARHFSGADLRAGTKLGPVPAVDKRTNCPGPAKEPQSSCNGKQAE